MKFKVGDPVRVNVPGSAHWNNGTGAIVKIDDYIWVIMNEPRFGRSPVYLLPSQVVKNVPLTSLEVSIQAYIDETKRELGI